MKAHQVSTRVAALAAALFLTIPVPARVWASSGSDGGAGATTTTIVASEGPVPAGGQKPQVGPFLSSVHVGGLGGYWWLVGFGGLQLVGLAVVTRRARARTRLAQSSVAP